MPQFDVFLSHSSADKPWVIKLKDDLQAYGVSVWLDNDEIRPGDLFAKALEQGIANSRAVALIVSPEATASGWVEAEYYRALSLAQNKNASLQLIPVILRDAELPGFLTDRNCVDFREESAYSQKVWKLVWGITGNRPAAVLDLSAPNLLPTAAAQSPRTVDNKSDQDNEKADDQESKSIFLSTPALLTAIAAIITAATGLIIALSDVGVLEPTPTPSPPAGSNATLRRQTARPTRTSTQGEPA